MLCYFTKNHMIGGAASVTVTRKDYLCLRNEEFLNDVIIDFYLKYLQHGFFINDPAMQVQSVSHATEIDISHSGANTHIFYLLLRQTDAEAKN